MNIKQKLLSKIPRIVIQKFMNDVLFTIAIPDHTYYAWHGVKGLNPLPLPYKSKQCILWDLGCNVGVHTINAAQRGWLVHAFDISKLNIECLRQTAHTAQLSHLTVPVHAPITVNDMMWKPAETGRMDSKLETGLLSSARFDVYASTYGIPDYIKMDIEGAEKDFLESTHFKEWITKNKIILQVECHGDTKDLLWPEFKLHEEHQYIFNPF